MQDFSKGGSGMVSHMKFLEASPNFAGETTCSTCQLICVLIETSAKESHSSRFLRYLANQGGWVHGTPRIPPPPPPKCTTEILTHITLYMYGNPMLHCQTNPPILYFARGRNFTKKLRSALSGEKFVCNSFLLC